MKKLSHENNFHYLFTALMLLLFSMALLHQIQTPWLNNIIELIILLVLLVGAHTLQTDKPWRWTVYFMALTLIVFVSMQKMFQTTFIVEYFHLFILLFFFIGSFKLSFKQIIMSTEINQNMLVGSIVLYLLLGLIWTIFYLLLLNISPEAFNGLESLPWQENFSRVAYYSFVTLTTLGYGDISPRNSVSEFFVYSEAIVGVFYMAIIVSSMVSARLNTKSKHSKGK